MARLSPKPHRPTPCPLTLRRAARFLCLLIFAACCIWLALWLRDAQRRVRADSQLAERFHGGFSPASAAQKPEEAAFHYARALEELYRRNEDFVGWITVPGTAIDYPVVRGPDNDFYLNHDFDREPSKRGAVFLDYRCDGREVYPVLYGHHMKDGTMFRALADYRDAAFAEAHPDICFFTPEGGWARYRVTEVLDWDESAGSFQSLWDALQGMGENSARRLLCLTTCDNSAADARIIVVAEHLPSDGEGGAVPIS